MNIDQLLKYENLIVILAVMGVIEGLKKTFNILKIYKSKPVQIALPYLPLGLGAVAGLIPGIISVDSKAMAVTIGIGLGAIGGQVWKIIKTKIDLLQGKFNNAKLETKSEADIKLDKN